MSKCQISNHKKKKKKQNFVSTLQKPIAVGVEISFLLVVNKLGK